MKITRKGQKSVVTVEEELSTIPLESIITPDSIKYPEPLVLFKITSKKETTTTVGNHKLETLLTTSEQVWEITKQKNIDAYLAGQLRAEDLYSHSLNKDISNLVLLDEEQVKNAEKANMFTVDEFDITPFNTPYVNTNKGIELTGNEHNVKFRLGEIHNSDYDYILRTSDNTYLTRPMFVSFDSDKFNLSLAVEKIKGNKNFIFIDGRDRNRNNQAVIPHEELTLSNVISSVPYYNQNPKGDLHEVKGYYIPTTEELKIILQDKKSSSGYKWTYDSYKDNDVDFKKNLVYGRDNIIAYSLGAVSTHKEFNSMKIKNKKDKTNQQPL